MRKQLVNILLCPVCGGNLNLTSKESCGDTIIEGSLKCESCELAYGIKKSIPNLLPPALT